MLAASSIVGFLQTSAMDSMRRRDEILPTNWRTVTNVVSWVLLALVITTLIARFAVKLSRRTTRRILLQDDVFLLLAAVSFLT